MSLLEKIQNDIIHDSNEFVNCPIDSSLVLNNCFSPLREVEVLCDYILDLFVNNKDLTPADIAVVSPNIENHASAIESVFGRYNIPFKIADRDIKKSSKTAQLLNLLFSQIGSRHEAPDIVALFDYSLYVQGKELDSKDRELLEKWTRENAIRHGLESSAPLPNYSFESGFEQLASGFFMISETGFSEKGDYCYPDIEGSPAKILGDFISFVQTLQRVEAECKEEKNIEDWDYFFKENLQEFFGTDETDFNEDKDNPYQKVSNAWDSLKKEMLIGFGSNANTLLDFSAIKNALPRKLETSAKSSYSLGGRISFSNIETVRAVPHKIICCIGMNGKEFPHQKKNREISLMAKYELGDKDSANEDRQMFLETILSAKEALYISWVGQNEKNAEELEPSSVVIMLLKYLKAEGIKHPLQPFSKKSLATYDTRWNGHIVDRKSIWKWEVEPQEREEKKDVDVLYRILSKVPRYFLRDVCNIELPEQADLLSGIEPFVLGKLEEWSVSDLILNDEEDYRHSIKIQKIRGDLPSGKLIDRRIEALEEDVRKLKEKAKGEEPGTFWIFPNEDKGKYRLRHWLKHLDLNMSKRRDTKMFLLEDKTITLAGMSKEKAAEILEDLWKLSRELDRRILPIFPNAAFEYLEGNMQEAEREFFREAEFSEYARMLFGEARTIKELGVEEEFVDCSKRLFGGYFPCRL